MASDTVGSRLQENAAGIASLLVTGLWMAALFTDQSWWLAALIVGYVVVVPLVSMLFDADADDEWGADSMDDWWDDTWGGMWRDRSSETTDSNEPSETPLETIRRRYAAGELTEAQFERKLERLLETETLEDVEDAAARNRLQERES